VKPGNCLFVAKALKLADFGLLTRADRQLSRVGTLKYMPPDGQMDARADVYAAGLVIYQMMTGLSADSFPHLGPIAGEIAEDPILTALNRLVLRASHPDPRQRFADARQMLDSLETSLRAGQARRRRAGAALAAVFVIGLVVFGLWLRQPNRVHVNFITEPYGARILLDGEVLEDPATGIEYTTPCSVPNLTARVHHVVFQSDQSDEFDAGPIDFTTTREVIARFAAAAKPREHAVAIGTSESER
jgi:hypothetical protein